MISIDYVDVFSVSIGKKNCTGEMFSCDNGYCLRKQLVCDGVKDCIGAGEDEKDCMYL